MSAMNDVVISGMSGRFPLSNNTDELANNLYSGVDMITEDDNRWPKRTDESIIRVQTNIGCELIAEAFCDAGLTPNTLSDSKTGVFISMGYNDMPLAQGSNSLEVDNTIKSMIDRIVLIFDIKHPMFTIETNCASDLQVIHSAVYAMKNKRCERAVVLRITSAEDHLLGMTSIALLLQKRSEAKRVYVTAVHTKRSEQDLDEMRFTESLVSTGCLTDIKPQDKGETEQTLGADKSGICHTNGSSGLTSLIEVMIDLEDNDMHRNVVNNDNCFVFRDGKIEVIVRADSKWPSDENNNIVGNIPRLVLMCGRSEEELKHTFNCITNTPKMLTRDYLSLINDISKTTSLDVMKYRGFAILDKTDDKNDIQMNNIVVEKVSQTRPQIWFVCNGGSSHWPTMGKDLLTIDICAQSLRGSAEVMKEYNINLMDILVEDNEKLNQCLISSLVSITAIHLAQIDLLTALNVSPDGFVGICFGDITSAYMDRCITAEEALKIAYSVAKCSTELTNTANGAFVSVFCPLVDLEHKMPDNVFIACHVADSWQCIMGESTAVDEFVRQLNGDGVATHAMNAFGFPYHTPLMSEIREPLKNALKNIIPDLRLRSHKWISSTYEESNAKYRYISADYFTEQCIEPLLIAEAFKHIPPGAVVVEVSPRNVLKQVFDTHNTYIPLMTTNGNNVELILQSIGKLYTTGAEPCIEVLYPGVSYPVSRGTQSMSSTVRKLSNQGICRTKGSSGLTSFIDVMIELNDKSCSHDMNRNGVNGDTKVED